jgi:hypothetical protein
MFWPIDDTCGTFPPVAAGAGVGVAPFPLPGDASGFAVGVTVGAAVGVADPSVDVLPQTQPLNATARPVQAISRISAICLRMSVMLAI